MDPGTVDNRDGENGAAVAQKLREEMERDRARADASRIRKTADRFSQAPVEVDRAANAEAVTPDAKKKEKLEAFFTQDADALHEKRLEERMAIRVSTRLMYDILALQDNDTKVRREVTIYLNVDSLYTK